MPIALNTYLEMVEFQNQNGNSRFAKPLFFEKFPALPNTQLKSSAFFSAQSDIRILLTKLFANKSNT